MVRLPDGNQVKVTVYRITGRQLFFNVGRSVCEECDLAVAAVTRAIHELDGIEVGFSVKAWINSLPLALAQGAYHPPVTLVDGVVISQGVVPAVEDVKRAIVGAAERRTRLYFQQSHPRRGNTLTTAGQASGPWVEGRQK